MHQPCPFWPDDGRCVLRDCHVEECDEVKSSAYNICGFIYTKCVVLTFLGGNSWLFKGGKGKGVCLS